MPAVRQAVLSDAQEIARLLTQLGHPTSAAEVQALWPAWAAAGNDAWVVPRADGTLAALAVLHRTHMLHRRRPVGRITALVVDEADRGAGLGRSLVAAAEARLAGEGCELLEITSHRRLTEAHAFYEHLGYEYTSLRFAREL